MGLSSIYRSQNVPPHSFYFLIPIVKVSLENSNICPPFQVKFCTMEWKSTSWVLCVGIDVAWANINVRYSLLGCRENDFPVHGKDIGIRAELCSFLSLNYSCLLQLKSMVKHMHHYYNFYLFIYLHGGRSIYKEGNYGIILKN